MVQRRLRAGAGVEHRASAGREPPQENLRLAAGDRLVTSHRLKPRPAVLTPRPPVERMWSNKQEKGDVWVHQWGAEIQVWWSKHTEKRHTMRMWAGQASQILSEAVIKFSSVKLWHFISRSTEQNKLTFFACLHCLRPLMGYKRSFIRGLSKIRQDIVYSHHLSLNQRADRG